MIKILFAFIFFCQPAFAGPDRVSILIGSKHFGGSNFNEVNPGVLLTWEGPVVDVTAGIFENSYGDMAPSVLASVPVLTWGTGEVSIFAGLAYYGQRAARMKYSAGGLIPVGGVQIRQGYGFLQVMPSDGKPVDAILAFGLTFPM